MLSYDQAIYVTFILNFENMHSQNIFIYDKKIISQ